ncbi:MAG TPA: single-stranded DNA-binding protein [Kiritimatiellae bacterium]|nr:single-stranded DNA-binding protein [Kiritimatiellia bacterium]
MVSLNRVFLAGNLTRDPEVRYTPSGTAVADLSLAVNRTYTSGGERREETCFVNVVVWGRQAENCGQYLGRGSPVLIEGRLQLDQWQTDQGEKRSQLRVVAIRVQFLGRPRRGDFGGGPPEETESAGSEAVGGAEGEVDDTPF